MLFDVSSKAKGPYIVAMLANTYWFMQTSKKGFLYDCSCESCPCSFSFFSSITNPVRIQFQTYVEVATIFAHQVI